MIHRITLDDPGDYLDYRLGMGDSVEIYDIAIHSERRRGRGRQLVNLMLENVRANYPTTRQVFAITRISNTIAHEFYEALGFNIIGRLHYFYVDEHALMYGIRL